jgi:hypothetical protein
MAPQRFRLLRGSRWQYQARALPPNVPVARISVSGAARATVIDIFCFGPPAKPPYKRWKKTLEQIASRERFDMQNYQTPEDIDRWVQETRHKVMYRDESKID